MQRRAFLSFLGRAVPAGLLLPAGAGTYAVAFEPSWIEVRSLRVPMRRLPRALDGLRVVQISDIHRSEMVTGRYVREAVETALALRPELIALTGDFITADVAMFRKLAHELKPLGDAAPAFAVPGNHDTVHIYQWDRARCPDGTERLGDALAAANVTLLRNERRRPALRGVPDALEVIGLDDFWSPAYDPERAFDGVRAGSGPARLVLSHNPDSFRSLAARPFELLLAGHTHGGQVRIPLLGAPVVPIEDRRFVAGLVAAEQRLVYVNRGLGYNRRIRFGVRPEITLLELAAV